MSDAPTVLGQNEFIEQPKEREWSPQNGWMTVRTFKGPNNNSLVRAKENSLILEGALSLRTSTSVPAVITGKFPDTGGLTADDDQEAEDKAIWRLRRLEVDKKLSSHPKWNNGDSSTRQVQAKMICAIDKSIKDGICDPSTLAVPYCDYATLRIQGVETYSRYTYIITKSYSLAKASSKQLSFPGTMMVVNYGSIGVPSSCKWTEPQYEEWDGSSYSATPLKWLEIPPDIDFNEYRKKYDIVCQWIGAAEFSGTLYMGGNGTP